VNILLLTTGLSTVGGRPERFAAGIAGPLHQRARIRVVVPRDAGGEDLDTDVPYEVVRVGGGTAGFVAASAAAVRRSVATDGFDVALAMSWHGALAALVGRPREAPLRIHLVVHGPEMLVSPIPGAGRGTFDRIRAFALGRVDAFHPASRAAARQLAAFGVQESRVHPVDLGADPKRFAPVDAFAVRRRLGVGSRPLVLTHAPLEPGTGTRTVLLAMADVLTEHPRTVLVVAGSGSEEPALRGQASELGIQDAVRFIGTPRPEDLPLLHAAADVFVLAPEPDAAVTLAGGSMILEAGSCGVPTVGSRVGDIPDALQDGVTGLLVPPGKPEAVAAAVLFFLNDRGAAAEFGQGGRHHVVERANWDRIAERILRTMAPS
jgi:glycosyltransferase involved in cell wall biosynthesis